MDDHDTPTCGKGLAANADLPARLAQLLAARAEVLERHTHALDVNDANSIQEKDAYHSLVRGHRAVVSALEALSQEMAGYRTLPMGQHDMAVMMDPNGQRAAFAQFVELERGLVDFLSARLAEDVKYL
jgi:hypothetical protein